MSQENTLKRRAVFFCRPQDVPKERDSLPNLLDGANTNLGHDGGSHLESLDWNGVPPGAGPPSPRITSRVREADLVIICFWARWGIPPGADSPYTSGAEEEFYEALDARERNDGTRPEIWLFFQDVPAPQMADQGLQLTKVREFQGRTGKERLALYKTCRDPEDWVRQFQDYLRTWLRKGSPGHTVTAEPSSPTEPRDSAQILTHIDELRQALKEAQQAQVKLRQAALRSAIAALTAHSRGDLLSAETSYAQALDLDDPFPETHYLRALELYPELVQAPGGARTR